MTMKNPLANGKGKTSPGEPATEAVNLLRLLDDLGYPESLPDVRTLVAYADTLDEARNGPSVSPEDMLNLPAVVARRINLGQLTVDQAVVELDARRKAAQAANDRRKLGEVGYRPPVGMRGGR
jgi:hypothetical protein